MLLFQVIAEKSIYLIEGFIPGNVPPLFLIKEFGAHATTVADRLEPVLQQKHTEGDQPEFFSDFSRVGYGRAVHPLQRCEIVLVGNHVLHCLRSYLQGKGLFASSRRCIWKRLPRILGWASPGSGNHPIGESWFVNW